MSSQYKMQEIIHTHEDIDLMINLINTLSRLEIVKDYDTWTIGSKFEGDTVFLVVDRVKVWWTV